MLADVGLVGFPNAGKSTFLSVVSNARPEIADYAFTTLTPNLGVADIDDTSLLIADIPGLIEGASEGKGLGDAFLRHVERTSVLLHLIDAYSDDIAKSYTTIRNELAYYSQELSTRPEIVALTKSEGLDDELLAMQVEALKNVVPNLQVIPISSSSHQGLQEILRLLAARVHAVRKEQANQLVEVEGGDLEDTPTIRLAGNIEDKAWKVTKQAEGEAGEVFVVAGRKIEKFARRTNFNGTWQDINRLRDIMKKMGITHELIRSGATGESIIRIGSSEFTLVEQ